MHFLLARQLDNRVFLCVFFNYVRKKAGQGDQTLAGLDVVR